MDSTYIKHPSIPFNQCHTKEETILVCEERQGVLFQNVNDTMAGSHVCYNLAIKWSCNHTSVPSAIS